MTTLTGLYPWVVATRDDYGWEVLCRFRDSSDALYFAKTAREILKLDDKVISVSHAGQGADLWQVEHALNKARFHMHDCPQPQTLVYQRQIQTLLAEARAIARAWGRVLELRKTPDNRVELRLGLGKEVAA